MSDATTERALRIEALEADIEGASQKLADTLAKAAAWERYIAEKKSLLEEFRADG